MLSCQFVFMQVKWKSIMTSDIYTNFFKGYILNPIVAIIFPPLFLILAGVFGLSCNWYG